MYPASIAKHKMAVELYGQGLTLEKVGEKMDGITRERVRQILKEEGVPRRKMGAYILVSDEKILESIKSGKTAEEAAKELGMSTAYMYQRSYEVGGKFKKKDITGPKHWCWKGGRFTIMCRGGEKSPLRPWVVVRAPGKPVRGIACNGRYVYEHVLVASRMLGRPIGKDERVYHKNGITNDNRPENLEVRRIGEASSDATPPLRKGKA